MREYKIYTEDVNREEIVAVVSLSFPGFTIYEGVGYWQNVPEKSLTIVIVGRDNDADEVHKIADNIRRMNAQSAVLITSHEIDYTMLITPPKEG